MSDALTRYRRSMSERQLMDAAIETAALHGWLWHHMPDEALAELAKARRWEAMPAPGFPDLVLLRGNRLLVVETKAQRGVVSPDQEAWLAAFRQVDVVDVAVWWPDDRDELVRVLR